MSVGRAHTAVTPSDTVDISTRGGRGVEALFVGTGGNISVLGPHGNTILYKNVASGQILPIAAKRVMLTGTTAADIVGWYDN